MNILDGGEKVSEFGEFVIVRCEECAGPSVFLQMFNDGPGDAEAVECGCAAADFVEENETLRRGMIQDAGNFRHFDEECGAATGEVVAGANAREDAVGDGKFCLACRNERAHLREKNN